jgi:hypothetical protein
MPWVNPSPFGAFAAVAGGVLSGAAQAKKDKADADRQAVLDRAAATAAGYTNAKTIADTDEARARTTGLANTASHQHLEDLSSGLVNPPGAIPPTFPTAQPGKPPPSNRDFANYYSGLGAFYTRNSQLGAAKTAVDLADKYGNLAKGEEASAIALRKEANTEIETQARMHHWTADEKQKAKDEADKLLIASNHDATSVQNTQSRVAAIISSANIAAASRLKVAGLHETGADRRLGIQETGRNKRAAGVQAGATGRTVLQQTGATARTNITHGGKGAKPRSLTPEQEAAIKLKATSLVQGGTMTKEQVRAALVDEYNLAPDQADAIVAEPDDE